MKALKTPEQKTSLRHSRYIGLLYISPWIIGFLVFQLYPFIVSFIYSFTEFSVLKAPVFIGFKNYVNLFTKDNLFYQSLKVTWIYVLIAVPGRLIFALFVAMILNMKLRAINIYRTIYYLPSILGGSVAVSVLWRFLFSRSGLINILLNKFSMPPIDWLGSPDMALYTISFLTVWQFGSSMVLFLAGLKQIPGELYEAARVDGAGKFRMFFNITMPMLTPIIFFNLIMQMVNCFQEFTSAFVVTQGGPLFSTYLYGYMLYEQGFRYLKMGYASAQSWILFLIIMGMTMLAFRSASYWIHYEDEGDF